jgi:hypothetical protein
MRFIRDNYLSDAPMSEIDRHLFAFASYNAGPNRIAAMRRRAKAQGLDPNVVQQRGGRHGREDRHRDHDLLAQHLQVLRGVQARAGEGARETRNLNLKLILLPSSP